LKEVQTLQKDFRTALLDLLTDEQKAKITKKGQGKKKKKDQ